eukprot:6479404-Amphidinium_carterae.1
MPTSKQVCSCHRRIYPPIDDTPPTHYKCIQTEQDEADAEIQTEEEAIRATRDKCSRNEENIHSSLASGQRQARLPSLGQPNPIRLTLI